MLPIAPKQLKPKLTNFHSLRENEKESKLKQKRNDDRRHRAHLLAKVKTNDKVWIKDQKKSETVKTESNEPRSYIIQTDSGEIRRNRRHFIVKIPESVKDNGKITSETAPDNSSKSDNENKDIPDNLLTRIIQSLYYAPAGRPAIVPIEGAVLFELDNLSDQTDYRENLKST